MGSSKEAFCHRIDVWHSMAFSFRSVGLCAESRSRGRGFQGHKSFLIKESGLTEGLLQSQLGVWYECNKSRYQADFTQEQIRSIYYVLRISLTMSSTTLGDDGQEEFGWQFGSFTQVGLGPTTASGHSVLGNSIYKHISSVRYFSEPEVPEILGLCSIPSSFIPRTTNQVQSLRAIRQCTLL